MEDILLSVRGLKKYFPIRKGWFAPQLYNKAVDDVSFDIPRGQTLALVGESGSGKSTVGLMLLDLLAITEGEILYNGQSFASRRGQARLALRREMQVVFQDPYASLNARMNVRETVTEGMIVHGIGTNAAEREARAAELLRQVNLPAGALDRYPHEFSGGPAPTHRHRPRPVGGTQLHRPRRANQRPGCQCAEPDSEPVAPPATRKGPDVFVYHPQPRRGRISGRRGGRHGKRPHRRARHSRRNLR